MYIVKKPDTSNTTLNLLTRITSTYNLICSCHKGGHCKRRNRHKQQRRV